MGWEGGWYVYMYIWTCVYLYVHTFRTGNRICKLDLVILCNKRCSIRSNPVLVCVFLRRFTRCMFKLAERYKTIIENWGFHFPFAESHKLLIILILTTFSILNVVMSFKCFKCLQHKCGACWHLSDTLNLMWASFSHILSIHCFTGSCSWRCSWKQKWWRIETIGLLSSVFHARDLQKKKKFKQHMIEMALFWFLSEMFSIVLFHYFWPHNITFWLSVLFFTSSKWYRTC